MSGVRIYVANSATASSLILDGSRLDLFIDESIMLTLKQTDIRDIAVNYSTYSQDFTIPASATNNNILKYWYDTKNDTQQVSSIPTRIDIDGVFFKFGVIKILSYQSNGSGKGDNKFYTVQFSSSLRSLKDTFADSLISSLNYNTVLSATYSNPVWIDFSDNYVRNNIISSTTNQDIEIPIISTTRNINSFTDVSFSATKGIKRGELRPALKFRKILEAIEEKYNITFSGSFINGTTQSTSPLDSLYLWLNKNENIFQSGGTVLNIGTSTNVGVSDSVFMTYTPSRNYITTICHDNSDNSLEIFLNTNVSGTASYMCKIQEIIVNNDGTVNETATSGQFNFGIVAQSQYKSGNQVNIVKYLVNFNGVAIGSKRSFRFIGETLNTDVVNITTCDIGISNLIFVEYIYNPYPPYEDIYSPHYEYTGAGVLINVYPPVPFIYSSSLVNRVGVAINLPDLSVQDFITSLIKMYNLVIVPDSYNTTVYNLEPFSTYYGKGETINITKYCNTTRKLNKIKTYKKLSFKHSDSEYGSNKLFKKNQFPTREYGELSATVTNTNDTDEYKIETKFNLLIFNELNNIGYTSSTYGLKDTWISADATGEDGKSVVVNKPTIFYYNGKSSIIESKYLGYVFDDGTVQNLQFYSQFSNIDNLTFPTTTLCFSSENMLGKGIYEKNLYSNGYESLISQIYSPYVREFEIDAYLPKFIYTTISLNNLITIGNENFTITDITLNLLTGKSNLKLNNVIYR